MKFTVEQYVAMDADIAALPDSSERSVNVIWERYAISETPQNPLEGWSVDGMSWPELEKYVKIKRGEE